MASRSGFDSRAFDRTLYRVGKGFRDRAERSVVAGNRILADRVRKECPVDTGQLRGSVAIGPVRRGLLGISQEVTVGTTDPRKIVTYVHDGTSRMAANPFFDRAVAATERARTSTVTRVLRTLAAGLGL